jgi:hypothetical protein
VGVVTKLCSMQITPQQMVMRMIVFLAPIFCSSMFDGTSKKK